MDGKQGEPRRKKKERDTLRIKDQSAGTFFIVVEQDTIQGISALFTSGDDVRLLFVDV